VADAFIADPETSDQDGTIIVTVDGPMNTYTVPYGASTRKVKAASSPAAPRHLTW